MPDNELQSRVPQGAEEASAADQPDPHVQLPKPVWISKSYMPGKEARTGQAGVARRRGASSA